MAEKRKKGECYFCPEKFFQDHKCAMKGVFLMELSEEDDPKSLADDLGISLHALTGISSAKTKQLMVTIAWIRGLLIPLSTMSWSTISDCLSNTSRAYL
jgi:hypothetical protein